MLKVGIFLIIIGVVMFISLHSEDEYTESYGKKLAFAGFCVIAGTIILGMLLVDFYLTSHPQ